MAWGSGYGASNYKKRDETLAEGLKAARRGDWRKANIKVLKASEYAYLPSNHPTLQKINEAIRKIQENNPAKFKLEKIALPRR